MTTQAMEALTFGDDSGFRRALVVSAAVHAALLFGAGLFAVTSPPEPVSQGFVVELVEVEEPVPAKVEAPVESAAEPEGTLEVPKHRPMPKTKPRPAPKRAKPKPKQAETPPRETPPKAAPAAVDETPGGGGQVETDVPFPFDYYTETVTRLIMGQWVPTAGTPDGTRNVVEFDIYRDGSVHSLRVLTPAGNELFDRSALSAVKAVGRFPPLPQGFGHNRVHIRFHFEYGRTR